MKKYLLLIVWLMLGHTYSLLAQSDTTLPWDYSGVFQLNFQQVQLKNWQGGGENTIALTGFTDLNANYIKGRHLWTNRLTATEGFFRQGTKEQPFRKSDDDLHFTSKYSNQFHPKWNTVALLDLQTYLLHGYDYQKDSTDVMRKGALLSRFFAPAYMITAIGIEYKPSNIFYAMLAPVSVKYTFVMDDSLSKVGAFGVDPGKTFRAQFGATFKSLLKWEFVKNAELQNEISLFGDYKDLKAIDVDENLQLIIKANSFLTAKAGVHVLYDQDVDVLREDGTHGPDVQVKEGISLGIQYSF